MRGATSLHLANVHAGKPALHFYISIHRFIVDRRIFVVGFGMYGSIHGPSEYEVTIQIIHTATGKVNIAYIGTLPTFSIFVVVITLSNFVVITLSIFVGVITLSIFMVIILRIFVVVITLSILVVVIIALSLIQTLQVLAVVINVTVPVNLGFHSFILCYHFPTMEICAFFSL